jgi:hypothetical protein
MNMKSMMVVMVLGMLLLGGCINYSSGERVGQIVKFSHKGVVWKTWEGQMNLGGTMQSSDGVVPTIFEFSLDNSNHYDVDNAAIRATIETCLNTAVRCKIHYEQELFSGLWRSETSYFVTSVQVLNETKVQ